MKIKNKEIKGAIFDLDGTLLDSLGVWYDVDVKFFKNHKIEMPKDYQDAVKNMHFPTAAFYTKERFSLPDSVESIIDEWRELCFEAYENSIRLKDGAYEFIKYLRENNIKIAYATANEENLCKAVLTANGVWDCFSVKSYVSETEKSKAEPDVYLLAANRLGVSPKDCIVFEDILQGVKGAKKGNFTVCGVYDIFSDKDSEEIKRNADFYIKSFKELI